MPQKPLIEYLNSLEDPRLESKCSHVLSEVVFMATCAMMCEFDTWSEITIFAQEREKWFKKLLSLPCGIPSHGTFNCVFAILPPESLKSIFQEWVQDIIGNDNVAGQLAIDGKATRMHWSVENHLHWILDVAFKEDQLQARAGFAGENLAVIRQWILNMLKQNKSRSLSMANKRRLCCLNEDYLFESMALFNK